MNLEETTFTIDAIDHKARLDVYLTRSIDLSRSKIQKAIKLWGVTINGKETKVPHTFLMEGDVIELPDTFLDRPEEPEEEEEVAPKKNKPERLIELDIIYEDDQVLVINKAAGDLVHPTESSHEDTIMAAALRHAPEMKTVGDKPEERAGIVHRLDRMVSGVMILAKTQDAFDDLKKKFQKRFVHKRYHALLNGRLELDHNTITLKIARNKRLGRMVARPESQEGKEATTSYKILARYANSTEIDVDLHTGRTHQIRVHMQAIGHALVGETVYTIKNQKMIPFPRLWLHAYELELALPGATEATLFKAPLPETLTELLTKLHRID